ncbi:MAG: contractile injection system protein, VgrG/Pvc8 family [Sedimenticolaceae bacterium]|jgi:hypothetical protein
MAIEYRVFLNAEAASQEALCQIREVRIDQAIGMATEAELELDISADDNGVWNGISADFNQPFERVRIEVKASAEGEFVPLIEGLIIGQHFELTPSANGSRMTVIVHDDSALLNREETVELFEEQSASDIASQLFSNAGLIPEVDSVEIAAGGLERAVVQRGTAMQLLRDLARRHGMFTYVKPGDAVGTSIGVFAQADLSVGDLPQLRLMGEGQNIAKFECEFDGLRPTTATARSINLADKSVLSTESQSASLDPLGARSTHEIVQVGNTLLARTREESADLDAATQAVVDFSSWAYSAEAEVSGDSYQAVLQPHVVVTVAGPGGYLGGDYLVSRVLHTITNCSYRQQVSLRRNARADADNGGSALPGGVF